MNTDHAQFQFDDARSSPEVVSPNDQRTNMIYDVPRASCSDALRRQKYDSTYPTSADGLLQPTIDPGPAGNPPFIVEKKPD